MRFGPALVACALALVSSACNVVHPSGWDTTAPTTRVSATPGVMYGWAPLSYDLPDGRRVVIEVDHVSRRLGTTSTAFVVRYASEPRPAMRCATEPQGPGVPAARFGCWSLPASEPGLTLWIHRCAQAGTPGALGEKSCWEGTSTTKEGEHIRLEHAYLQRSRIPVGRISWVGPQGPLLAANIQLDTVFEMYAVAPQLSRELHDQLLLLTVALAWWEHASTSD